MSTTQHDTIDFVTLDPQRDLVVLVMIEERSWGSTGLLLPDLQAKLNTYFEYVTAGQLARDYPMAANKKVAFQQRCAHPPGKREEEFFGIVQRQHLQPAGIAFEWVLVGASIA